jgi:hypothetical protein
MSGGPNLIPRELLVPRSVRSRTVTSINWDRGFIRLWCLTSGAWAASWAIYATISNLDDGLWTGAAIKIPVALSAPPAALLVIGFMTKWALRGFRPKPHTSGRER